MPAPPLPVTVGLGSDFIHLPVGQHVQHDLCAGTKAVDKCFGVSQDADLPLGVHEVLEELFLLLCERRDHGVARIRRIRQRPRVLAVPLEAPLPRPDVADVQFLQDMHAHSSLMQTATARDISPAAAVVLFCFLSADVVRSLMALPPLKQGTIPQDSALVYWKNDGSAVIVRKKRV